MKVPTWLKRSRNSLEIKKRIQTLFCAENDPQFRFQLLQSSLVSLEQATPVSRGTLTPRQRVRKRSKQNNICNRIHSLKDDCYRVHMMIMFLKPPTQCLDEWKIFLYSTETDRARTRKD
jgi:hypothetical protein